MAKKTREAGLEPSGGTKDLKVGQKVRVHQDPEKKSSIGGVVTFVHDGNHAFNVRIQEPGHAADGSETFVFADGVDAAD